MLASSRDRLRPLAECRGRGPGVLGRGARRSGVAADADAGRHLQVRQLRPSASASGVRVAAGAMEEAGQEAGSSNSLRRHPSEWTTFAAGEVLLQRDAARLHLFPAAEWEDR